jgi:hypothetical protein
MATSQDTGNSVSAVTSLLKFLRYAEITTFWIYAHIASDHLRRQRYTNQVVLIGSYTFVSPFASVHVNSLDLP